MLNKIKLALYLIWDTIVFWVMFPYKVYKIMKDKELTFMGALEYMDLQYQHEIERLEKEKVKVLKIRDDNREKIYKEVIKILNKKGYKIK